MYHLLYPLRTFLVVSGGGGEVDVMAADWVTPVSSNPLMVGVAISRKRYTYKLIKESGEFVISVPTLEMLDDVWVSGTVSGPGKIRDMGLTFIDSEKVRTKGIKEAAANLECTVADERSYGDHVLFVGNVVNSSSSENAFINGFPDLNTDFLAHVSKNGFATFGKKIHKI